MEFDFMCKIVLCIWKFYIGDCMIGLLNMIDFVEKNICIVFFGNCGVIFYWWLLILISIKILNIFKIIFDDFYRRNILLVEEEKKE